MWFYGSESRPAKAQNAPAAAQLRSLRKVMRRPAPSLVSDLHPGSLSMHRRKVLDNEVDRLGSRGEAAIAHALPCAAPAVSDEQFGRRTAFVACLFQYNMYHANPIATSRVAVE